MKLDFSFLKPIWISTDKSILFMFSIYAAHFEIINKLRVLSNVYLKLSNSSSVASSGIITSNIV